MPDQIIQYDLIIVCIVAYIYFWSLYTRHYYYYYCVLTLPVEEDDDDDILLPPAIDNALLSAASISWSASLVASSAIALRASRKRHLISTAVWVVELVVLEVLLLLPFPAASLAQITETISSIVGRPAVWLVIFCASTVLNENMVIIPMTIIAIMLLADPDLYQLI